MSSTQDEMQKGLNLYNEGKYEEALQQFDNILKTDPSSPDAKKYAGIAALQLKKYDKALDYFTRLEKQPGLFSNPGLFYHALTLLKRNLPGDKQQARRLLEQVVQNNLEGKDTAQEWLKKL